MWSISHQGPNLSPNCLPSQFLAWTAILQDHTDAAAFTRKPYLLKCHLKFTFFHGPWNYQRNPVTFQNSKNSDMFHGERCYVHMFNGLMKNCTNFPCQIMSVVHVNGMSTACQPNNELWAKHEWRRGCIQSQKFADCTQNKMPKKTKRIVQLFFHCVLAKNWQHVWTKITAWRAHWHSPLCSVHLVGLNPYLTLSAFLTIDENIGNWFKKVTPRKLQVNISSPRPCPSTGTLTGMVQCPKYCWIIGAAGSEKHLNSGMEMVGCHFRRQNRIWNHKLETFQLNAKILCSLPACDRSLLQIQFTQVIDVVSTTSCPQSEQCWRE